jgi:hypothetical protein
MMKTTLFSVLFFISLQIFGQAKYMEGSVVLAGNKVISGFVEYRDWAKNPTRVNFRETQNGTTVSYSPAEIMRFEVTGICKYRSVTLDLDANPVAIEEVKGTRFPSVNGTYLLKVLVEGEKATLYEWVDFKPHFFISFGKDEVKELGYHVIFQESLGTVNIYNEFHDQLKNAPSTVSLTEEQKKKIGSLRYTSKDLTRFIQSLNGENLAPVNAASKKGKRTVFFAGAGVSRQSISFSGASRYLNSIKSENSMGYLVTGGVDFLGERDFQRLIMRTELTFSSVTLKGEGYTQPFSAGPIEHNEYLLEQRNITPSVSVLYQLLTLGKTRIYGGFGVEYNVSFFGKNQLTSTSSIDNESTVYHDFPQVAKSWLAYGWKAGTIINKQIEVGVSGKLDGSLTDHSTIGEDSKRLMLWVTYRMNKKK